jgi:hypothetical protein
MQALEGELQHIRSELQYALLTSDRNSNVIKKLIARSTAIEEELSLRKGRGSRGKKEGKKRSVSLAAISQRDKCFESTVDIVITARKELLSSFR